MGKTIGIISDTHGILRPEAVDALRGSHMIIHAGDVGDGNIIKTLETIAPVHGVRGNIDKGPWGDPLPLTKIIHVEEVTIFVIHDISKMDLSPENEGVDIVISGHSHKSSNRVKDNVLYVNPGGAGRRRFNLPLTIALLHIDEDRINVEIKGL